MFSWLKDWLHTHEGERGQGLVEYALTIALVAIVVILVLVVFGEEVDTLYHRAYSEVSCAQLTSQKIDIYETDMGTSDSGLAMSELAFYRREGECTVIMAVDYSDTRRIDRDAGVSSEAVAVP